MALYSGIACDYCGTKMEYLCHDNRSELVPKILLQVNAKKLGWKVGKETICPSCRLAIDLQKQKEFFTVPLKR